MTVVGGHDVLAGRMTLGGFFMFVLLIGLVAAPLVQIASIGTQISEAFAGLDPAFARSLKHAHGGSGGRAPRACGRGGGGYRV